MRDPERKGPSLGPNAGGVSLDRQRLGTTAGKRDKMTYQSRFGVRADTPGPTGNSELFKRPYRLLYLPWRKASCRETKDVPHLKIQGHTAESLRRRHAQAGALGAPRCIYTRRKMTLGTQLSQSGDGRSDGRRGHLTVPVSSARQSSRARCAH